MHLRILQLHYGVSFMTLIGAASSAEVLQGLCAPGDSINNKLAARL